MTPPARTRLDLLLVARGLAESREKAQALILAGRVAVEGRSHAKAGMLVPFDADIRVLEPAHPWVGRGGVKLAHALDSFRIDATGRLAVDIGASTGGFTDVLLQRGASRVIAVDVGRGQLHRKLRGDPRVTLVEGVNARALEPSDLPGLGKGAGIVTIDVSFISLKYILPSVLPLLCPPADVVALVKPQFEAGRADVEPGGLVTDPVVHARVLAEVTSLASAIGLTHVATVESPITGSEGNREFFLHLRADGGIDREPRRSGDSPTPPA